MRYTLLSLFRQCFGLRQWSLFFHKKTMLPDAFRWSGLSSLGFRDLGKKKTNGEIHGRGKSVTAKISAANVGTVLQSSLIKFVN